MAEQMKEHGKKVWRKHEKSGVFFIQHENLRFCMNMRHIGGKLCETIYWCN